MYKERTAHHRWKVRESENIIQQAKEIQECHRRDG
jgi:hypothetical protein